MHDTKHAILDTLPALPSYMQTELDEITARSAGVRARALARRPWSQNTQHIGDYQAQRRLLVAHDARAMQAEGVPERIVIQSIYQRLREIETLTLCGCDLLLIGNEDCPRCAVSDGWDTDYDNTAEGK